MDEKYKKLSQNSFEEAYDMVEKALEQIRVYLALTPEKLTEREMKVIGSLGQEVGDSGRALEEKANALEKIKFISI